MGGCKVVKGGGMGLALKSFLLKIYLFIID